MSPVQLEILLNIYYSPVWRDVTNRDDDFMQDLLCDGIISPDTRDFDKEYKDLAIGYKLTDLGIAWVKDILNTPYPRAAFLDKAGNVIQID